MYVRSVSRPPAHLFKPLFFASVCIAEIRRVNINMASQTPVWFITAASSGFGKYIALDALSRGHRVIASARSTTRIADLEEKGAITMKLDVTAPQAEIEEVAKAANEEYGYINHLVNAVGYILVGAVEETS